jgi:thioredoxin 1
MFSRDEEYKRRVEHSVEPIVVTFLSPLDDKCKAVASKIEELSNKFATIKFYQVDVRKHMSCSPVHFPIQHCPSS